MTAAATRSGPRARPPGARPLTLCVLLAAAGAGLALLAAGGDQPPPAAGPDAVRAGADPLPWLRPVAWALLAGAGAVVAVRGAARLAVGVLLAAGGLSLVAGAVAAWSAATAVRWPLPATVAAGALLTTAGVFVVLRGRRWPGLGARFERPPSDGPGPAAPTRSRPDDWAALDRGEDPTLY